METMRYQENRKSYKGAIFGFCTFVIIGGGLVALGISQEKKPQVIGSNVTSNIETQSLVDVSNTTSNENTDIENDIKNIIYEIKNKEIIDKENSKLKGNITLPQIFINDAALSEINNQIENEYTTRFESLKNQMVSAENKFTYKVTYNKYDNEIDDSRILSLTIYQRVIDDSSKETTTDKVESYNIDLKTGKTVEESTVMLALFGKEYKEKVNNAIKSYVINKGYAKEEEFTYTVTGLENYYIKDSKLHILLNEDEVVDKKHGVLDITIE